jgi:hypothetical protein
MINKLKYLFLLILCAGLIGSAVNVSAQSNNQSDTNGLINYYEWLFETQFTSEQRSQYNEIKDEDYRLDYANEKQGINSLMASFAKIKSKNENEQANLRSSILGNFVKQLQDAGSGNKEAVFLLSVYNDVQMRTQLKAVANGTGDISAYVGTWVWAHTGISTISTGGAYMGSNGSRFTYEFSPNGDVQFTGIMNVMQGGCNQQIFRSIKGKASVSGNNLTISWQPEKFTRDFSCDTANNYTKTIPAKTEKFKISFKTDLGQKQMCFLGSECFSSTK